MSNSRRNRGKKNNKNNERKNLKGSNNKCQQLEVDESESKAVNDPSWYSHYPELLKGAANVNFSWALGNKIFGGSSYDDPVLNDLIGEQSLPGVMTLTVIPGPGLSDEYNSPINIASRNIYSFLRHANSGHTNYESTDLMMYLLGMDSAYSYYAYMCRIYGLARNYYVTNKYYPKALIHAMGVDFEDIMRNLADFRYYINSYAVKLGSMCVPAGFDLMSRHAWLFSNVYLDEDSEHAQSYMFIPKGFHRYEWLPENGGQAKAGGLKFSSLSKNMNLNAIIAYGNGIVDALMQDEDCGIISGDILKAYGSDKLYKFTVVDEGYTIDPVFVPEVITQIENATVNTLFSNISDGQFDITQDEEGGFISYDPMVDISQVGTDREVQMYCDSRIINMHVSNPSPEAIEVATRFTTVARRKGNNFMSLSSFGSDIVVQATIYYYGNSIYTPDPSKPEIKKVKWSLLYSGTPGYFTEASNMHDLCLLARSNTLLNAFQYHPQMSFSFKSEATGSAYVAERNYNPCNIAILTADDLSKMHECAMISMFYVPQHGKANNQ